MPETKRSALTSTSVARHLARGVVGFGLVGAALALVSSVGVVALLLAPIGMVALGGCPTCWIAGLFETISAGRVKRSCAETSCTLTRSDPQTSSIGSTSVREIAASRSSASSVRRSSRM
jgi:hypothetical protein